jgi:hypothetical protein
MMYKFLLLSGTWKTIVAANQPQEIHVYFSAD